MFIPLGAVSDIASNANNLLIVEFVPEGNLVDAQAWKLRGIKTIGKHGKSKGCVA
jgi:hypothetical protein